MMEERPAFDLPLPTPEDRMMEKLQELQREKRRVELLEMVEGMGDAVAAYTGLKKQFVDQGWSESGAEGMVVAIARMSGR